MRYKIEFPDYLNPVKGDLQMFSVEYRTPPRPGDNEEREWIKGPSDYHSLALAAYIALELEDLGLQTRIVGNGPHDGEVQDLADQTMTGSTRRKRSTSE